jgi:hypothetical protein
MHDKAGREKILIFVGTEDVWFVPRYKSGMIMFLVSTPCIPSAIVGNAKDIKRAMLLFYHYTQHALYVLHLSGSRWCLK